MTNTEKRAAAYVKRAFGGREVYTNPRGYEEGFYHYIEHHSGGYYTRLACIIDTGHKTLIVDVTRNVDRIMKYLD
jgi:hypothetical protein